MECDGTGDLADPVHAQLDAATAGGVRGKASKFPGPSQVQGRTSPSLDWSVPQDLARAVGETPTAEFQLGRVIARALLF